MKIDFFLKLFWGVLLAVISCHSWGGDRISAKLVLIIGSPSHVSLAKEMSGDAGGKSIEVSNLYDVVLTNIRAIKGKANFEDEINLKLVAGHSGSISLNKEIFALLELHGGEVLNVLYWGIPQTVVCVPELAIKNSNLEASFRSFNRYDGSSCSTFQ